MNLEELSNYFVLTTELLIGILAFQGIATTFIFSKKGEWTYMDVWLFFWLIFNNVTGTIICVFGISLMITITDVQEVLEITFNFIFVMLAITTYLFVYSDKKLKQRSLIDKEVAEEFFHPLLCSLIKFIMPLSLCRLCYRFFTTTQT